MLTRFQKDFKPGLKKISTNEYLMLAGTLHSVHALTTRLSPIEGSSGLEVLETSTYALHCFQTLTGLKFIVITDLRQFQTDVIINKVYQLFGDYVMKNPFYQLDMPVRCDLFDRRLGDYLSNVA